MLARSTPLHAVLTSTTPQRTVLLTGASGVVGHALLSRLREVNIICLVHRTPVSGLHVTSVRGNVSQPHLGLPVDEYARLAARVDAVIHCAAITDFSRDDAALESTNVIGARHVQEFAAAADATLYHVSTAFVHAKTDAERGRVAVRYAASKRAGEESLRDRGLPHVILRPSVVIGDSWTGEIKAFQGLHKVAAALLSETIPMIPFDPSWRIDFVPCDYVADVIATVVEKEITSGEFWITSGEKALSIEDAVRLCVDFSGEVGAPISSPRFVPPDLYDRLIRPAFFDALPRAMRMTIDRLLEFFAVYLASGQALPSSRDELAALGVAPPVHPTQSLRSSLRYFVEATGTVEIPTRSVA
jgi:nucleoside-diphosphate-sugar epimerase